MIGFLLLAVAGALLATGADLFADHVSDLAGRLGVSSFAVAFVLAGAEPEELVTSTIATVRGRPGLALGDAVGANVTILTLVLGIAALTRGIDLDSGARRMAVPVAGAALLAAVVVADGRVLRPEAAVLLVVYGALATLSLRDPPRTADGGETAPPRPARRTTGLGAAIALGGVALMTAGGWVAVMGATRVAEFLPRSDSAVGLTLLGFATSCELIALVWASARHNAPALPIAAVLGSVTCNATITIGIPAMMRPLHAANTAGASRVVCGVAVLLAGGSLLRVRLARLVGILLLCAYVGFVALTLG